MIHALLGFQLLSFGSFIQKRGGWDETSPPFLAEGKKPHKSLIPLWKWCLWGTAHLLWTFEQFKKKKEKVILVSKLKISVLETIQKWNVLAFCLFLMFSSFSFCQEYPKTRGKKTQSISFFGCCQQKEKMESFRGEKRLKHFIFFYILGRKKSHKILGKQARMFQMFSSFFFLLKISKNEMLWHFFLMFCSFSFYVEYSKMKSYGFFSSNVFQPFFLPWTSKN